MPSRPPRPGNRSRAGGRPRRKPRLPVPRPVLFPFALYQLSRNTPPPSLRLGAGCLCHLLSRVSPVRAPMALTVAARFCISLGTMILVALPSATFSIASMLRSAR